MTSGNLITGNAKTPGVAVGIVTARVKGPVSRFDLLTTSALKGYAEKAAKDDFGAIIGKAMEPCANECVINVLVGLR